jgi:hypothetical protein
MEQSIRFKRKLTTIIRDLDVVSKRSLKEEDDITEVDGNKTFTIISF